MRYEIYHIWHQLVIINRSMSSLNLSIKFQPLLRLVPPLKMSSFEQEHLNKALSTIITQQSFSNANWLI